MCMTKCPIKHLCLIFYLMFDSLSELVPWFTILFHFVIGFEQFIDKIWSWCHLNTNSSSLESYDINLREGMEHGVRKTELAYWSIDVACRMVISCAAESGRAMARHKYRRDAWLMWERRWKEINYFCFYFFASQETLFIK